MPSKPRTPSASGSPARAARRNALQAEARRIRDQFFRRGLYKEARRQFHAGYEAALAAGERDWAARFLGNSGGCEFALHRYQDALRTFQQASRMAAESGDFSAAAALDINISSLYSQMGENAAAGEWIEKSLPRISGYDSREHLPKVLIQLAIVRAETGRTREAEELFARGIDGADENGDLDTYAVGCNRLGSDRLHRGDLHGAEPPLLEAYRVLKLNHRPLDSSYRSLGRLRLKQGDLASASALLDIAVQAARDSKGALPTWELYHTRGRVWIGQGRYAEALDDLRVALRLSRIWRFSGPPDDAARVGVEFILDRDVHSALVEAATRLYRRNGSPALLRESFEAAEENRAASLRALAAAAATPRRERPPQYWDALARLQAAETRYLRSGAGDADIRALRAELIRMEARPGRNPDPEIPDLARRTQKALRSGEALLVFQFGIAESYLWALDRAGLSLHILPPREKLAKPAAAFATAVREGRAASHDERLYAMLFGSLEPRFRDKPRWLVDLDHDLFGVPLAALAVPQREGAPKYLVQLHELAFVPGAAWLVKAREGAKAPPLEGGFLAVADPIYNTADPRWKGARPVRSWRDYVPARLLAASRGSAELPVALSRLAASATEVESCATMWGGQAVMLRGAHASGAAVERALAGRPAVAHFATHVLESGERPRHGLIALSLSPEGRLDLLGPREIGAATAPPLVVLSGCGSGAGEALPGAGLMGLTRAWLAAGTRLVAASYWPTADDGALFPSFYRHLKSSPRVGAAGALRRAQLDMLGAGGWHAAPLYWGAYFATGID